MRVNRDGTNYRSIGPADQFTMLNSIHAYQSSMYSPGISIILSKRKFNMSLGIWIRISVYNNIW